jgi:hypothetical protein
MKSLYESILSDIETNVKIGDEHIEDAHKLHYSYKLTWPIQTFRAVEGGLGYIFKTYFPKKPIPIKSKHIGLPIKYLNNHMIRSFERYNTEYLATIILNTKFEKPFESYDMTNYNDYKYVEKTIEDNLNSYLKDEYKNFKSSKKGLPLLSVYINYHRLYFNVNIVFNGGEHEQQKLCKLEFR